MKNITTTKFSRVSLIPITILLALSIMSFGCGGGDRTKNGAKSDNLSNQTAGNTGNNTNGSTSKNLDETQIPVGKPIEGGINQTSKNVSITIPKDWKKVNGPAEVSKFASSETESEAITVAIMNRSRRVLKDGPSQPANVDDYSAQLKEMGQSARVIEIGGMKGVLLVQPESYTWTTFPPSDADGQVMETSILITFPRSKFEQNKQLISDVLYSIKIK